MSNKNLIYGTITVALVLTGHPFIAIFFAILAFGL